MSCFESTENSIREHRCSSQRLVPKQQLKKLSLFSTKEMESYNWFHSQIMEAYMFWKKYITDRSIYGLKGCLL